MKRGLYFAVFFAFVTALPFIAGAEPATLDPRRLMFDEKGKVASFDSKRPKEMMSRQEFVRYEDALSKTDCQTAARVLHEAFVRTYPQFRSAKVSYDCAPEEFTDCFYWESYAQQRFKDFAFCMIEEDLQRLQKKLSRYGNRVPKYAMPRYPESTYYHDPFLRSRDRALSNLIGDAEDGYVPALEKVADLIRQGDVFSARNDVEYYVLRRACILSEECAKWQTRLDTLKNEIGLKRTEHIDAVAIMPKLKQPRLNDIVLGKPI